MGGQAAAAGGGWRHVGGQARLPCRALTTHHRHVAGMIAGRRSHLTIVASLFGTAGGWSPPSFPFCWHVVGRRDNSILLALLSLRLFTDGSAADASCMYRAAIMSSGVKYKPN